MTRSIIDPSLMGVQLGPVLVLSWRGPASLQLIMKVNDSLDDMLVEHPKVAVISCLEPGAQPPNKHSRQMVQEQYDKMGTRLGGIALFIPYEGFWASINYVVARAILLGRDNAFAELLCRSEAEGAAFLAEVVDQPTLAGEIEKCIHSLRAKTTVDATV